MSRGRRESEVQAGVMAYLSTRPDFYWWRQNTSAGIARSGQFMRSGVRGASDLIGLQAPTGRMVAIECKRETGGRLSPDQELFAANVRGHGGLYIIATNVATVHAALGEPQARVQKALPPRVIHR